ncbi:FtsB family cell division protein [Terrihabitans sp. B22-R8]|uniref:FtsB family cell division protein n=1 Tax=Terrihabitans sp. B22-R8 TaxID=3425128 RepID=UPI00403CA553
MIVRTRIRAIVFNVCLWLFATLAIAYFGYHSIHGERGLRAHRSFEVEIAGLKDDLSKLVAEREALELRVEQFEPAAVDRDLLDEEARRSLGWLSPDDRILMLPASH